MNRPDQTQTKPIKCCLYYILAVIKLAYHRFDLLSRGQVLAVITSLHVVNQLSPHVVQYHPL